MTSVQVLKRTPSRAGLRSVLGALLVAVAGVSTSTAQETVADSTTHKSGFTEQGLGGPTSVPNQLEEQDAVVSPAFRFPAIDRFLDPYFQMKKRLRNRTGLSFGMDYAALVQKASESLGEDRAASGIFRAFGKWEALGRGSSTVGSLVFKVESRHAFTSVAPQSLGFEFGYVGLTGTLFSDPGWVLNTLYWEQSFADRSAGFAVGRVDFTDWLDILGYGNPWRAFQNLAVVVNPSLVLPDQSFGVVGGSYFTEQVYAWGIVADANGSLKDVEFFPGGSEFFKYLELAWQPSRDQRYFRHVHVGAWHVDERTDAMVPESWGVLLSANWFFEGRWMPFFRAGWSDGEAPLMNGSVTGGVMRAFLKRSDVAGVGFNWGSPSTAGLRDQYTSEFFYRFQFSQNLSLTPSLQWLVDPALNPDASSIWVFGLRSRLTL